MHRTYMPMLNDSKHNMKTIFLFFFCKVKKKKYLTLLNVMVVLPQYSVIDELTCLRVGDKRRMTIDF